MMTVDEHSRRYHTRLVAMMKIHGVRRLLTFNTDDFSRYPIDAIHPTSLLT